MSEHKHSYMPLKKGYYKLSGSITGIGLPGYNQSVAYATLYCPECGETKEVISADHRKDDD